MQPDPFAAFDRGDTPQVDDLLERVRRQQEEIERIQRNVESMLVQGRSQRDEVSVTVQGTGRLTEVTIDPRVLRQGDARALGEFVVEAVNDGLRKVAEASTARFAPVIESASRSENFQF
ncbi:MULTISPECIES: YbaB/EbfC family nucleoid-associated protein [unclassified Crossiella]|uniref:YbaB/EbfC family nucleoid-associated protein n=1 Tax=unclassified Crossiella TaxID=2620835 RepID=UPI001FFE3D45|nr:MULTISPECIES: YbaB/EbfC family nucleoid-associated protein [unclassified Crossiella]MCK2238647.1 YbaB/EbfC family nucleoid-associated protein [Crossiella sp. S99.2]MCK2251783.1 YbaB/EbfC family nucleoid-associated protein [Crossiella sp. S99.1]